jgi:lipopolysaccharide/colanic/teichoic acid biosynthesis glycosyltransferase
MHQDSSSGRASPFPLSSADRALKRAVDLFCAAIGFGLLLPVFVIVMIALKLESREPAFTKRRRYSCFNTPVWVLEFRTVVASKDGLPRVSRFGRMLRRTRIDELPQLLSVLMGEMSLVGPKPHIPAYNNYGSSGFCVGDFRWIS